MQIIYWVHYLLVLIIFFNRQIIAPLCISIAIIFMILIIKGYAFLINIVLLYTDKSAKPPGFH